MLAAMLEGIGESFVSKDFLKKGAALYDQRIAGIIDAHPDLDMGIVGQAYAVKCMSMGGAGHHKEHEDGCTLAWLA